MISVLLTASNDPKALARLLTALVPAAADGLVRQVAVVGAAGVGAELSVDAGADLHDDFASAAAAARGPWLAGLPLDALFAADWMEQLADHLAREPATAVRLTCRPSGFSLRRGPRGWLVPKRLAPSAGAVEQDFQRLARLGGGRLRLLDRR